jgi:hypothetical protein
MRNRKAVQGRESAERCVAVILTMKKKKKKEEEEEE